ncbi:tyrosine-type recombinase/integrase [Shinella sumterensis]|uniref:Tyrosine-type recombinase/integrase n=1 Tax=Shinella sumterensis TaxID=1967501 RepID=A0AA50CRP5_9HYPH|nr:tyrosine-type recombinase/integrase [Shinella sumterensis]WLS00838.1 tyrosine-type recombinase/integrase [Shinella sumterensis]
MPQIIDENSRFDAPDSSAPPHGTAVSAGVSAAGPSGDLPSPLAESNVGLPAHLRDLTERARGYVAAASSANTRRAYAADWTHFTAWCRRQNLSPLPPNPQVVGLYITACASGTASGSAAHTTKRGGKPDSVSTIERRLAALGWNYAQRGEQKLDRKDRAIATVMAGIRNRHAAPPRQKEAILPEDLIAMLETLDRGSLRGLRDRSMLLIGFAGGLRRSEITGLDLGRDQTEDGRGWIEIFDKGALLTLRGKTGWREVEIGRGSSDATCPVAALEAWIKFARLAKGPLFRRVTGRGKDVGPDRLNDQEVARLVKKTALAAGIRGDLPEIERGLKFAGHSLRAGLASSAEVDERYVQKQLGHASAEMTRRYQRRRDRFRVNLTKAAGL